MTEKSSLRLEHHRIARSWISGLKDSYQRVRSHVVGTLPTSIQRMSLHPPTKLHNQCVDIEYAVNYMISVPQLKLTCGYQVPTWLLDHIRRWIIMKLSVEMKIMIKMSCIWRDYYLNLTCQRVCGEMKVSIGG